MKDEEFWAGFQIRSEFVLDLPHLPSQTNKSPSGGAILYQNRQVSTMENQKADGGLSYRWWISRRWRIVDHSVR